MQGQSRAGVVLQLADRYPGYQNPQHPREMVNTRSDLAQRFFNSIRNCTFDTGRGSVTIREANFGNNRNPFLIRQRREDRFVFDPMPNQIPGAPGGSMIPFWVTS